MDVDQVVSQLRSERRNLQWDGEILEQLPTVTRRHSALGEVGEAIAFDLSEQVADQAILEEVARARRFGKGLEWKVFSFDLPGDLIVRLQTAGFVVGEKEAVVAYDLADGLSGLEPLTPCDVRRVEGPAALDDFKRTYEAAFGKDCSATVAELADALRAGRKGHDAYVGYEEGQPASVGRLYTNPRSAFAGLYGGGTLPGHRGRGLYRSVLAARARDAAGAGARYLLVDALPTSLPILLRLGFTHIADTWPCTLQG